MSKKIVLKVDITGERCKAVAMSTVAKVPGIKSMAVDGEKKTLTVVGEVNVVCVANALRKAKYTAEIVSVGPEEEEKKPDPPKTPDPPKPPPPCCAGFCNSYHLGLMPPFAGKVIYYEEQPDGHGWPSFYF